MTGTNNRREDRLYRVAVDAMGGDFAPAEIVEGALLGARLHNVQVILVGDPPAIHSELNRLGIPLDSVHLVSSKGSISEGEHPARALRNNPLTSIAVTTGLVKTGKADAMVSMGSTGGAMASAALALGLFPRRRKALRRRPFHIPGPPHRHPRRRQQHRLPPPAAHELRRHGLRLRS